MDEILGTLRSLPPAAVYAVLLAGALIEYVVPPFPGDTVVVAGAALVGAFGWPVLPVAAAVTLGAVLGAWFDLEVGRWLVRSGRIERLSPRLRDATDRVVEQLERRGAVYLAVNRFVPGIRFAFFVAAGVAGLRTGPVLLWATLSASAWNALLIGLGLALGSQVERLAEWVERYTLVAGGLVAIVIVVAIVRLFARGPRRQE